MKKAYMISLVVLSIISLICLIEVLFIFDFLVIIRTTVKDIYGTLTGKIQLQ